MTVAAEVEAEIARLFAVEHWKVGTIAAQLGVHHDVVRRVLGLLPAQPRPERTPLLVAPYDGFIKETLLKYPRLCSTRLFDMLRDRGYLGSERTLRRFVAMVRPTPNREAFLRLDPLIGEQAQVDWAHVGQIPVPGGGSRTLWLFVMVLAWSRAMWGEFCFDTTVHSLLRSLARAAAFFAGCTRQWLFDNPKIVVLERHGDVARFHPLLLDLGSAMHVQLRLCAPYRGNEKGRVERKIRFLRDRFLAGREIHSIEQGNCDLLTFIDTIAHRLHHPNFPQRTIADCLVEEKQRLLPLPNPLPATDLITPVLIDKTAFARFDTNIYSVSPDYVERTLTLVADDRTVRLLDGAENLRMHPDDQHFLVIGAIEDADPPAFRQMTGRAPEKIMFQLLGAGLFETENLAALRIDPGHDVPNGAVFPASVHPLKDQQQRLAIRRVVKMLQRA